MNKEEWALAMHAQIAAFVTANIPWLGLPEEESSSTTARPRKLLDYACGNGFLTAVGSPQSTRVLYRCTVPASKTRIFSLPIFLPPPPPSETNLY
jgi:hypothetical protein